MDGDKVKEEFERRLDKVSEEDIERAVAESERIEEKVAGSSVLSKELAKVRLLISALRDYWNGEYEEIPYGTIAAIVVALLYILSPIDLIPDTIPVAGQMDDLMILLLVWRGISEDIKRYAEWKIAQGDNNVAIWYEEAFA